MAEVDIEREDTVQSAGQSVTPEPSPADQSPTIDDIVAEDITDSPPTVQSVIEDTPPTDQVVEEVVEEGTKMGIFGTLWYYVTWSLGYYLWYLSHLPVIIAHLVLIGLLYHLRSQGVSRRDLLILALVEEAIAAFFWLIFPGSIGCILALFIAIYLYQTVLGPKVVVRDNAVLIADDDISESLRHYSPNLNFDVAKQQDGSFHVNTYLRYTEYHHAFFTKRGPDPQGVRVDEVTRVEEGCDQAIVRSLKNAGAEPRQCFFMTLGKERGHMVTFIAESVEERDKWLSALQQFFGHRVDDLRATWLNQLFAKIDSGDVTGETVSLDNAVSIMKLAQRPTDRAYVSNLFSVFAKVSGAKTANGEAALGKEQFGKFFDMAASNSEMKRLYEKMLYQKNGELLLTPQRFLDFLNEEQMEHSSLTAAKRWIKSYETVIPSMNMTLIGFTNYLLSEEQSILHRDHLKVSQDMTQPLSHYFIATSHNTYLTKDQLKGKSSVDAYISAFKRGCKCVELDCWDGPNNEPIIYHGHTLTSKILFKDVIQAINDYAFIVSDYPVILSFENHCSVEQQKVMAQYLKDILKEKVHDVAIPEDEKVLPSPDDLKGYIIIKNKKLKPGQEDYDEIDDDFSDDDVAEEDIIEDETEENEDNNNGEGGKIRKGGSIRGLFDSVKRSGSKKDKNKDKGPKIAQELSDLVHYCQATHFRNFDFSRENARHSEMSSFGEKRAMKFAKDDPHKFIQYNKRQMSRIYPAGGRIDSSNYDPTALWNIGCQLVALNYQTACREMQVNQGLFMTNGGCGYVLKPDILRRDDLTFDPRGPFDTWKNVTIRVLSGHQLPYSSEKSLKSERNFFIQVREYGVEPDIKREKTRSVKNNGFNPTWDEALQFKVHVPQLAFFQFLVYAKDPMETLLCQYSLPFSAMNQGYRRVPLQNKYSDSVRNAFLFVHVEVSEGKIDEVAPET